MECTCIRGCGRKGTPDIEYFLQRTLMIEQNCWALIRFEVFIVRLGTCQFYSGTDIKALQQHVVFD